MKKETVKVMRAEMVEGVVREHWQNMFGCVEFFHVPVLGKIHTFQALADVPPVTVEKTSYYKEKDFSTIESYIWASENFGIVGFGVRVALSIVRSMEKNGSCVGYETCHIMMNSRELDESRYETGLYIPTDYLFDDFVGAVLECLTLLWSTDSLSMENKADVYRMEMSDYLLPCYRAVQNCIVNKNRVHGGRHTKKNGKQVIVTTYEYCLDALNLDTGDGEDTQEKNIDRGLVYTMNLCGDDTEISLNNLTKEYLATYPKMSDIKDILSGIMDGNTHKEIAENLGVTVNRVEYILSHYRSFLGGNMKEIKAKYTEEFIRPTGIITNAMVNGDNCHVVGKGNCKRLAEKEFVTDVFVGNTHEVQIPKRSANGRSFGSRFVNYDLTEKGLVKVQSMKATVVRSEIPQTIIYPSIPMQTADSFEAENVTRELESRRKEATKDSLFTNVVLSANNSYWFIIRYGKDIHMKQEISKNKYNALVKRSSGKKCRVTGGLILK